MRPDPAQSNSAISGCPSNCWFEPWCPEVERCQRCGLGRTTFAPRPAEQQDYSHSDLSTLQNRFRSLERLLFGQKGYLREARPGSLLDVGCGEGVLLDVAEKHGWKVQGIDPVEAHGRDPRIVTGLLPNHQPEGLFDCVCMIHSFEHIPDPLPVLLKCATFMRSKGLLLIVVPNFGGASAKVGREDWLMLNTHDHCFHYTIEALSSLLSRAGFKVERWDATTDGGMSTVEIFARHKITKIHPWSPPTRDRASWLGRPVHTWLLKGVVRRGTRLVRWPCNAIVDCLNMGEQLIVLARQQ
jgi:SAM-dependent methyltransferase